MKVKELLEYLNDCYFEIWDYYNESVYYSYPVEEPIPDKIQNARVDYFSAYVDRTYNDDPIIDIFLKKED